ncbi:hypothetical protein HDV05_000448 [Chytridiales sp. JEL 0842]|nr:hypothetical protein HDV05_000448 [Chytridiales sp. JEL 0842]
MLSISDLEAGEVILAAQPESVATSAVKPDNVSTPLPLSGAVQAEFVTYYEAGVRFDHDYEISELAHMHNLPVERVLEWFRTHRPGVPQKTAARTVSEREDEEAAKDGKDEPALEELEVKPKAKKKKIGGPGRWSAEQKAIFVALFEKGVRHDKSFARIHSILADELNCQPKHIKNWFASYWDEYKQKQRRQLNTSLLDVPLGETTDKLIGHYKSGVRDLPLFRKRLEKLALELNLSFDLVKKWFQYYHIECENKRRTKLPPLKKTESSSSSSNHATEPQPDATASADAYETVAPAKNSADSAFDSCSQSQSETTIAEEAKDVVAAAEKDLLSPLPADKEPLIKGAPPEDMPRAIFLTDLEPVGKDTPSAIFLTDLIPAAVSTASEKASLLSAIPAAAESVSLPQAVPAAAEKATPNARGRRKRK